MSVHMELTLMKEFYNTAIEKVSYNAADTTDTAQEMYYSITEYLESIK